MLHAKIVPNNGHSAKSGNGLRFPEQGDAYADFPAGRKIGKLGMFCQVCSMRCALLPWPTVSVGPSIAERFADSHRSAWEPSPPPDVYPQLPAYGADASSLARIRTIRPPRRSDWPLRAFRAPCDAPDHGLAPVGSFQRPPNLGTSAMSRKRCIMRLRPTVLSIVPTDRLTHFGPTCSTV
jgi:hypothetical protein